MVQKYLRSYKSNQALTKSIFGDAALKVRDAMIGLHAAAVKVPAQKDAIFVKGLDKFQKYLVTGLNSFLLTLGSCDSDIKSQKREKQMNTYSKKMSELERLIYTLLCMFNDQYASGNLDNVCRFTALRQTLTKLVLRYLALMINFSRNTDTPCDEKFLLASVEFLKYERDNK